MTNLGFYKEEGWGVLTGTFICVAYDWLIWCTSHTQHAEHALSRGVWGHAPQKILKIWLTEIEFCSSLE